MDFQGICHCDGKMFVAEQLFMRHAMMMMLIMMVLADDVTIIHFCMLNALRNVLSSDYVHQNILFHCIVCKSLFFSSSAATISSFC